MNTSRRVAAALLGALALASGLAGAARAAGPGAPDFVASESIRQHAGVNAWLTGRVLNRIPDGPDNNSADCYRKPVRGPAKDWSQGG